MPESPDVGNSIDPSRSGMFAFTSKLRGTTLPIYYALPYNLPQTMDRPRRVVYYLHGLPNKGPDQGDFDPRPVGAMLGVLNNETAGELGRETFENAQEMVDALDIIVVCPNGGRGWWLDSPEVPAMQNRSYVVKELVPYIDKHLPTITNPDGRIIVGSSMGGFGALHIGFHHPDVFGAIGARIGAIEPTFEFVYGKKNYTGWNLQNLLGDHDNTQRWKEVLPLHLAQRLEHPYPKIYFDYGWTDALAFGKAGLRLHEKLMELGIPHDAHANTRGHQQGGGGMPVPTIIHRLIQKLNAADPSRYDGYVSGEYVEPEEVETSTKVIE